MPSSMLVVWPQITSNTAKARSPSNSVRRLFSEPLIHYDSKRLGVRSPLQTEDFAYAHRASTGSVQYRARQKTESTSRAAIPASTPGRKEQKWPASRATAGPGTLGDVPA